MGGLINNRAANLLNRGDKEGSIPYYAMAYYSCAITGKEHELKRIADRVRNELGFEFD